MHHNMHRSAGGYVRLRQTVQARRAQARGRREIAAVLAGHHGSTVRNELLAMLEGG